MDVITPSAVPAPASTGEMSLPTETTFASTSAENNIPGESGGPLATEPASVSVSSPLETVTPEISADPVRTEEPSSIEWWQNSKFGMFIHLGSYSEYAQGEWAMNEQKIDKETYQTTISAKFNPKDFNAEEIVEYAKNAGMKYLVITARHHEGFSMWDTQVESFKDYTGTKMYSLQQYTEFGSTGRDLLQELKDACDNAGIKFGLYYSILDWNHSSQTFLKSNFTTMASEEARTDYINDILEVHFND